MDDETFQEFLASVRQMKDIMNGNAEPSRRFYFHVPLEGEHYLEQNKVMMFHRDGQDYPVICYTDDEVYVNLMVPYEGEGMKNLPCWWKRSTGEFVYRNKADDNQ
jgi:hypothetical protein